MILSNRKSDSEIMEDNLKTYQDLLNNLGNKVLTEQEKNVLNGLRNLLGFGISGSIKKDK